MAKLICLLTILCASSVLAVDKDFIDVEIATIINNKTNIDVASKGEQGISFNSDIQGMKCELDNKDRDKTAHSLKSVEEGYESSIDSAPQTKDQDIIRHELGKKSKRAKSEADDFLKSDRKQLYKFNDNDPLFEVAYKQKNEHEKDAQNIGSQGKIGFLKRGAQEEKIFTCIQSTMPLTKVCKKTRVVRSIQPPDIITKTTLYFAANTWAGHATTANIATGTITFNEGTRHGSSRVENPLNELEKQGEIISVVHIGSRWWSEAGVHQHEVYNDAKQWPSKANGYVYSNYIAQGAMGRKKCRRANGNKYRGRVETWQVTIKPPPVLEDSWLEDGCDDLQELIEQGICKNPVERLVGENEARTIAGYPTPITREYWQVLTEATCGGDGKKSECDKFLDTGCMEVASVCNAEVAGRCVEYTKTYNCGTVDTKSVMSANELGVDFGNTEQVPREGFGVEDFAKAFTHLSMIDEMQKGLKQTNAGGVMLFEGQHLTCDREFGSLKNCCNLKGILRNVIGSSCPEYIKEVLAPAVHKEKRCVEIGEYCAGKSKIAGCYRWRKAFCCYQSDLAKILQQIAHQQLGISWGTPEHPNCEPISPEVLSKLNLDTSQAKQLLQSIVDQNTLLAGKHVRSADAAFANQADVTKQVEVLQRKMQEQYKREDL